MRREINKANHTETGCSVSHPPSGAWVFSEQSDPPTTRRQVEPAPREEQLPAARFQRRVDEDPPVTSWPTRGHAPPRDRAAAARLSASAHAGRVSFPAPSERPAPSPHPTPRGPGSTSAAGQSSASDRKPL